MNKTLLLITTAALLSSCAIDSGAKYEWRKPKGTTEERDRYLAEAQIEAIKAYPDPISQEQINAEPINAPAVRRAKRDEIIVTYMASKGWSLVPAGPPASGH